MEFTDHNPNSTSIASQHSTNGTTIVTENRNPNPNGAQPYVLMFPVMSQGHMIPMIDLARMIAARGLAVAVATTPLNAARIPSVPLLRVLELPFPGTEVDLPRGCESLDALPQLSLFPEFMKATRLMKPKLDEILAIDRPLAIVSDFFLPWTLDTAERIGVPRLVFQGISCSAHCCLELVKKFRLWDAVDSDHEPFELPGLSIRLTKANLPPLMRNPSAEPPGVIEFFNEIKRADSESAGIIFNSFYELEPDYFEHCRKTTRAWHVGPVSMVTPDTGSRGKAGSVECLAWLDMFERGTVVYACFGSMCRFESDQLAEIGLGLEATGRPFIWVVRETTEPLGSISGLDGFEERVKDRGLVIRGWAAQVLILSHESVGAFITHGGWNSVLEGVSSGLAMVTWPLSAEQFINAKMVSEVMGIGFGVERVGKEVVRREKVKGAVEEVMGEGGERKRMRAKELKEMGRRAVEEGGSSHMSLGRLVEDLLNGLKQGA
ncbi:hypothetical protein AMTRI_Chr06g170080 [Amborella trichopoda]